MSQTTIAWASTITEALERATAERRFVLVDFSKEH